MCDDRYRIPTPVWEVIRKIPGLRYYLGPVETIEDAYFKFDESKLERNSYIYVTGTNSFYVWRNSDGCKYKWEPLSSNIDEKTLNEISLKMPTALQTNEDLEFKEEKLSFADKDYNSTNFSGLGRIYLRKNIPYKGGNNLLTQNMFKQENTIYHIQYDYNLQGETIFLPKNSTLKFDGGSISNGYLVGNNSSLVADVYKIFNEIIIDGTWNISSVYSRWFDFKTEVNYDNIINFRNLMNLSKSSILTHIYIDEGTYYTTTYTTDENGKYINSIGINVPSNVYIHNNGTIVTIPNEYEKTSVFYLSDVENVTIDGGKIIGDVQTHHGSNGEWGYGIALIGARNIIVKNIQLKEHWGDGINIQSLYSDYENKTTTGHCVNILIDNIKSLNNRRQGLSIEGCFGCIVRNSEFSGSGSIEFTKPGAGICIEPWFPEQVVTDIFIDNCQLFNNKTYLIIVDKNNKEAKNITINNCYSDSGLWIRASNVKIENFNTHGARGYLAFSEICDNISIKNSIFSNEIYGKGKLSNITIDRCVFDISDNSGSWSGYVIGFSQTNDNDSSYKDIKITNNIFKDQYKARFIHIISDELVKVDLEGNNIQTASKYGISISYGNFVNNTINLTPSSGNISISCDNKSGKKILVSGNTIKSDNYKDSIIEFRGVSIVKDNTEFDYEFTRNNFHITSIDKMFKLVSPENKLRLFFSNNLFPMNIMSGVYQTLNDWDIVVNDFDQNTNFSKMISPISLNITKDQCYCFEIPHIRGNVVVETINKYTTIAQLHNTQTTISLNPDSSLSYVYVSTTKIIGSPQIRLDSTDIDHIPQFAFKVENNKVLLYIKQINSQVANYNIKLIINSTDKILYSDIKYKIIETPKNIEFETRLEGNFISGNNSFNQNITKYIGFQYFDISLGKKVLWNGTEWIESDGLKAGIERFGSKDKRPQTSNIPIGFPYFDTSLGRIIVWNGSKWINVDGTSLSE